MYQRVVRPMPGLAQEDERVFRYVAIYPNTVIDLYPDHVLIWKMNPLGVDRTGVPGAYLRRKNCDLRTRAAQWLNLRISQVTTHEDEDLVARMQRGLGNGDFTPGPLSLREKGVAWFAGRIRARPRRPAAMDAAPKEMTVTELIRAASAPAPTSPPRPARRSSTPPAR